MAVLFARSDAFRRSIGVERRDIFGHLAGRQLGQVVVEGYEVRQLVVLFLSLFLCGIFRASAEEVVLRIRLPVVVVPALRHLHAVDVELRGAGSRRFVGETDSVVSNKPLRECGILINRVGVLRGSSKRVSLVVGRVHSEWL